MTSNSSPFFNPSYIYWLRERAGISEYVDLSTSIGAMPFRSSVMMDRNRVIDGEQLRIIYSDLTGCRFSTDIRGCSVLEFLVALADRVNDTLATIPVDEAFRMFMDNMDISRCTDDWFLRKLDPERYIQKRCDIMMDRMYEPNGSNGGLFVIHDSKDIRPSEWWWQMQYWLNEQYIPYM